LFLEALKEKDTIEVLAKNELLPNQISMWKSEAIRNLSVFSAETVVAKDEIQQRNSTLESVS
jgi:hypothetical protein